MFPVRFSCPTHYLLKNWIQSDSALTSVIHHENRPELVAIPSALEKPIFPFLDELARPLLIPYIGPLISAQKEVLL